MIDVGLKKVKTVHQLEKLNHTLNLSWCAHMEKPWLYSNEVNFIKELHKWHDEKKRKTVAT